MKFKLSWLINAFDWCLRLSMKARHGCNWNHKLRLECSLSLKIGYNLIYESKICWTKKTVRMDTFRIGPYVLKNIYIEINLNLKHQYFNIFPNTHKNKKVCWKLPRICNIFPGSIELTWGASEGFKRAAGRIKQIKRTAERCALLKRLGVNTIMYTYI